MELFLLSLERNSRRLGDSVHEIVPKTTHKTDLETAQQLTWSRRFCDWPKGIKKWLLNGSVRGQDSRLS